MRSATHGRVEWAPNLFSYGGENVMGLFMIRLFGLAASLFAAGVIYYNWQELLSEGTYSFRIAGIGPLFVVYGLYIMVFPTKIGRPETGFDKFMVILLTLIGAAAGAYNWYLMDPAKFDF